ncbi:MAG: ATP-dependent zinc metalloprotease FtsH, partial [Candidatus Omnitrophica bacterium]|nr:ATP-dependent zinc metalloprotease FtsH [Candidatus Omnitrophota bacterium]
PFYSISGSDFVEMFVGVGASRVRDLFEQGKKSARSSGKGSIIFIDEIDAVGRQRFAGIGGGHDEREQTLNALLVEMDGFDTFEGVILIGATNRPDVLDPALLRPGRFDRQIVVDIPDLKGREEILVVHCRDIKLAKDVDLKKIARQTPGFSGADIANLVNEAALLAARQNKEDVSQRELGISIEKVMAGPERRSRIISKKEKGIVAVHESGHALVSLLVENSDPLHKVSIIPRGKAALGYTLQVPLEDRYLVSEGDLMDKITVMLSGRAAEALLFDEVTTGASNDLEVATDYAHRMVCEFGMSKKLGNLTFGKKEHQIFLGRDLMNEKNYSEATSVVIDKEVRAIIDICYTRAYDFLNKHKDKLLLLRDKLLEKEVLDGDEVCDLLGMEHRKDGVEYFNKQNGNTTAESKEPPEVPEGDNSSDLRNEVNDQGETSE